MMPRRLDLLGPHEEKRAFTGEREKERERESERERAKFKLLLISLRSVHPIFRRRAPSPPSPSIADFRVRDKPRVLVGAYGATSRFAVYKVSYM